VRVRESHPVRPRHRSPSGSTRHTKCAFRKTGVLKSAIGMHTITHICNRCLLKRRRLFGVETRRILSPFEQACLEFAEVDFAALLVLPRSSDCGGTTAAADRAVCDSRVLRPGPDAARRSDSGPAGSCIRCGPRLREGSGCPCPVIRCAHFRPRAWPVRRAPRRSAARATPTVTLSGARSGHCGWPQPSRRRRTPARFADLRSWSRAAPRRRPRVVERGSDHRGVADAVSRS